jgi:S1-C subfamily serine protease
MATKWLAAMTFAVTGAACGGAPAATPKAVVTASAAEAPREVHESITAHMCPARRRLAELLGHDAAPAAEPPGKTAAAAPPPTMSGGAKAPANQAYRAVAPATVLIRSANAMGTGVVIDPRGYVLTNYHVIADGRKEDFVVSVNVTFGDLTATGRMSRQEKTYEAVVVKADMVRDMAILKLKDPPKNLTAIKLAKNAPEIAQKVISIGHAGIGFLWAAKTCSVAAIGEREHDSSRLAGFDCTNVDPALSKSDAARYKERCDASKKQMTEAFEAGTQGLAVQTDCAITHGDSGGPLVNTLGELVGLNQSLSADLATVSFHVHVDEIREFIGSYPDDAMAMLPDPFCDGGPNSTLEDIDLDGVPETVVSKSSSSIFGGYDRMSLLIDLGQSHLNGKSSPQKADDPTFAGEIALLAGRDGTYVWYDSDNDARFDLLLVDKDNDGTPEQAYRIDEHGRPKEDRSALPKHDLTAKFVKDPALHARLGKIAATVGGAKYVSSRTLTASRIPTTAPDPIVGGGTAGRAIDSDGNGRPDIAVMHGTFSRAYLFDADESSLGAIENGDPVDDLVKSRKIDPELSVVVEGNSVWALYDTDNDAKVDLALLSTEGMSAPLVATAAWKLGSGGEMTPEPNQIGRKLLRTTLLPPFERLTRGLRLFGGDVATDEGLGSLPDPRLSSRARFAARELKGFPANSVVEARAGAWSTILVDLDHDTKNAKPAKPGAAPPSIDIEKFDAEIAVVHHATEGGGADYVFYDTDNDGQFDLVLFGSSRSADATQAYRLPKATALEVDASAAHGKRIRSEAVFGDKKLGARWKAIASQLFDAAMID